MLGAWEVTTHLGGLQYGTYDTTISKVREKHKRQKLYANQHLKNFENVRFMFWSPVVREGAITSALAQIDGLELIINREYARRIQELQASAKESTRDTGNPAFRFLQILAHLRFPDARREPETATKVSEENGEAALLTLKRAHRSWSWVQLRKGCLDYLGRRVAHSTDAVRSNSRTFARKAMKESGWGHEQILRWLDERKIGGT